MKGSIFDSRSPLYILTRFAHYYESHKRHHEWSGIYTAIAFLPTKATKIPFGGPRTWRYSSPEGFSHLVPIEISESHLPGYDTQFVYTIEIQRNLQKWRGVEIWKISLSTPERDTQDEKCHLEQKPWGRMQCCMQHWRLGCTYVDTCCNKMHLEPVLLLLRWNLFSWNSSISRHEDWTSWIFARIQRTFGRHSVNSNVCKQNTTCRRNNWLR